MRVNTISRLLIVMLWSFNKTIIFGHIRRQLQVLHIRCGRRFPARQTAILRLRTAHRMQLARQNDTAHALVTPKPIVT